MNKVIVTGRLVKDVDLRYTANNQTAVAKITLAVNRQFKKDGQPECDFLNIVVWGKQAENCSKYIAKGRLVAVIGTIQNRSWDDQDGKKHYATEIIAENVEFLDKAKEGNNSFENGFTPVEGEDNLPF